MLSDQIDKINNSILRRVAVVIFILLQIVLSPILCLFSVFTNNNTLNIIKNHYNELYEVITEIKQKWWDK